MNTKRNNKLTKSSNNFIEYKKYKYISCDKCNRSMKVDDNCIGGLCWVCTVKLAGPPEIKPSNIQSKFPPGWKFMSLFVDYDGNVYKYGELHDELKGTLEPTDVEKIKEDIKLKRIENKKRRKNREEKLKMKEELLRQKEKNKQKKAKKIHKDKTIFELKK